MNRTTQLLLSFLASAAVTACAGEQPNNTPTAEAGADTSAPAPAGAAATTGGAAETDFFREQLAMLEKQVGLARLVADRSTRRALKEFAERASRDYQQAKGELQQLATKRNVIAAGSAELTVEGERLSKLSGEHFEREYLDEIIADHEGAVRELESGTRDEYADVRVWSQKTLPVVRRLLEQARQLRTEGS